MKMKTKIQLIAQIITIVIAIIPFHVKAQFSGSGFGTENDPFLIFNPVQLNQVRNYLEDNNVWFKLMSDIDLEEWIADNNPMQGWQPIGNAASKFKGHFIGNDHKIMGLMINRSSSNYVGLFGHSDGASITNLILEIQSINGADYVGGLVGFAENTSLTSCSISNGNVHGVNMTGGIIGQSISSTIADCQCSTIVQSTGNYSSLCVGYAEGITVTNLKGKGQLTGESYVGGMIGYSSTNTSSISNSSIDGIVSGRNNIAGFVGYSGAELSIFSSHYIGEVNGSGDMVGGLVGFSYNANLNINNSYVIADVTGKNTTGGLVGKKEGADLNPRYYGTIYRNELYPVGCTVLNGQIIVKVEYYETDNGGVKYSWNGYSNYWEYRYTIVGENTIGEMVDNLINSNSNDIYNNYFNGSVTGTANVGGLIGSTNSNYIRYNYCYGNIAGAENIGGLIGQVSGGPKIYDYTTKFYSIMESNVAIVNNVNATQSNVGRIYGALGNDYVSIGSNGTNVENQGLATAKVTLNGLQQELPDGLQHGTNVGSSTLKLRATYQGIGWDFTNWQILETECYPYKQGQCAPPVINNLVSGATKVSGKSTNGGIVHLTIGDTEYCATTSSNLWSVSVPPLKAGSLVKAYAINNSLNQSYNIIQTVQFNGKGTEDEPYEIYTADDLSNINSYKYYKLMNDIDLTEWIQTNNPTMGWTPIGLFGGGSMRQLDGSDHKITGLWSNSSTDFYGLIASTKDATICNLSIFTSEGKKLKGGNNTGIVVGKADNTVFRDVIVNGSVHGDNYVGGLVGYCQGNTFTNCSMKGSVSGNNYVGGLASNSSGTITCSFADVFVSGNDYVGGLVGFSSSNITESYTTGTVSATNKKACFAGGLTGVNNGSISDCFSKADINSGVIDNSVANNELQQYAGGITGYNYGRITRCYASGDLFAVKIGAGVVGYNDGVNAHIDNCYAINNHIDVSTATGIAMRVIGGIRNGAPTPEANNYALKTMVVSVNNIPQTIYDDLLHGQSLTDNVLRQEATYQNNGWDMINVWGIDEDSSYPYLRALNVQHLVERGDIDGDGSVTISDVTGLIDYLLSGNATGVNLESADCDQDGNINISDVTTLIDFLLRGNWR
jgi:hypothetical protein